VEEDSGQGTMGVASQGEGAIVVHLAGDWKLSRGLPSAEEVGRKIAAARGARRVVFDVQGLTGWDSGLLTFLLKVKALCAKSQVDLDEGGLPEGVRGLLKLAAAVPERTGARRETTREPFLSRVGEATLDLWRTGPELLAFIGEATWAFLRLLGGKAQFQRADLWAIMQACGAQAFPIVSLICFLVGLILAFVGAVQLQMFGAQIYVAALVGVGMVRVLGAIMMGIIMSGRTGAAFAAELGTMQVNEEIDALKTMGINPMEFLVLPRMVALVIMMPLLCLYADLMGVLGGLFVGITLLDLNVHEYIHMTRESVSLVNLWIGLFHGTVFGVIVALSGCLRGMQCGRSASAVGQATTSAVVTSIVSIIVATAIITVICQVVGI
jgi:phospholipid/cholesterol/gamma-HCH transport system permease protein